jgi:serine/threonine-protein kinase
MRTHTSPAGRRGLRLGSRLALAATPALLAWALIPAVSASAATLDTSGPTTTFTNTATGNCLDSNSQFAVYDIACNGGNYQNWTSVGITTADGKGAYIIKDAQTGLCLDGNDAGAIYTHDCIDGDTYQEWVPTAQGSTLSFVSDQTGRALQADPDPDAASPDGTTKQQWNYTIIAAIPATPAVPLSPLIPAIPGIPVS